MTIAEIDALFSRTLAGDYEDDEPWAAVRELRRVGTREVLIRAAEFCRSSDPLVRARGIDVLAQLGKTAEHPSNSFPEESYSIVSKLLLLEKNPRPLSSAIAALGHLDNPLAVPLIVEYAAHPDACIRFNVACALGSFPNDPQSADTLALLTEDVDDDVRDWATFGLGVLGDLDSPQIREVLIRRLGDSNPDAREEAMAGLGKRHDQRVLPFLMSALQRLPVSMRVIEAAYGMLGMARENDDWEPGDYAAALHQRFGA